MCVKYSLSFRSFQEDSRGDWECRTLTLFVFFILQKQKKKSFVDIAIYVDIVYTNKSRPFTVSNDLLLLSVRSKIMKFFAVIRKKQVMVQVAVLILM